MASPRWADYLVEVATHLHASRTAVAAGAGVPSPPERPAVPIPDALRPQARVLAAGYDQLMLEVRTRIADIQQRRRGPQPSTPSHARFVDRRA